MIEGKPIVPRTEALEKHLRTYYTGEPCPQGHDCERYVSSKACVSCTRSPPKRKKGPKHAKGNGKFAGWDPTEVERELVRSMVGNGIPHTMICEILGIGDTTLRRHCGHDLQVGAAEANNKVASSLFWMATDGPVAQRLPAAIFWLKTRAGWREIQYIEQLRPPAEMSDDELSKAIQLAKESSRGKGRPRGRVVDFAHYRTGTPRSA